MLINSGKSSALKGDRGMKEKYSMFKFVFASLACCLMVVAIITGCGGGNNPAGPTGTEIAADIASGTATTATESLIATTYSMTGKVIVDENIAVGSITVKLLKQDYVSGVVSDTGKTSITLSSGEFSFTNLSTGTYVLKVEENNDYLESSKLAIVSPSNSSSVNTGNLQLFSKSAAANLPGLYTMTGKVINDSNAPVSGINVRLFMQDLTNNTITDTGKTNLSLTSGEFNFNSLAVGMYILKTTATDLYKESSKLVIISASTQPIVNSGNLSLVSQPTTGQAALTGKIVDANNNPLNNISVKLFLQDTATGNAIDTGKVSVTLTSGEFNFSGLTTGTYILKVEANATYKESSKLAVIATDNQTVNTGNMTLVPLVEKPVTGQTSLIGKVVAENNVAVGGVSVKLLIQDATTGNIIDTGRASVTLTSGEFNFNNLSTGTYILKIVESDKYLETSKLAFIEDINATKVDTGNLNLFVKTTINPTTPTLDIRAKLVSSLSLTGVSVAEIVLDSGQRTVCDGFGIFTLKYVERGTRTMTISQPGLSPSTLFFTVEGDTPPNAESIVLNSVSYNVNSGARTVDLVGIYDIQANPNLHTSGALMGTVKKYETAADGSQTEVAYPNYEFDLWQVFPDNSSRGSGNVRTDSNGTWRKDQLPPFEDTGAKWFAVPKGTGVVIETVTAEKVFVKFVNNDSAWIGREAVLAYGYKVQGGQTTVMNFVVPAFATNPTATTIAAITDAAFATNAGGPFTADIETSMVEDLYLKWTGPGTSTAVTVAFYKAYVGAPVAETTKTFTLTDTSATAVNLFSFKPFDIGLNYGRHTWKILAADTDVSKQPSESVAKLITIAPSNEDVTPREGTAIKKAIGVGEDFTVTFSVPQDPEATNYTFELYALDGGKVRVSSSNVTGNSLTMTFTNAQLTAGMLPAGNYSWQVTYGYKDGPPMRTEETNIRFID